VGERIEKMRTVLSGRLVKSKAAYLRISLDEVNKRAKLGKGYIYRLWGRDTVQLSTLNKIANVLGCKVSEILEEIE
jgi:DNA-binding Xre family transcriptional regulator